MAKGINKVILVGNLGQDPEVRYMQNGTAVANVTLATSESYKDKNTGQPVEKTEWHRVVIMGKAAEVVGEYCRKGSQLYVEGKLQTRKWTNQQGADQYTTEIVADQFNGKIQLLGGRNEQASQGANNSGGYSNQGQQQGGQRQQQGGYGNSQHQGQRQGQYQQAPQHQAQYNQGGPMNPNEPPPIDFDDDIPF